MAPSKADPQNNNNSNNIHNNMIKADQSQIDQHIPKNHTKEKNVLEIILKSFEKNTIEKLAIVSVVFATSYIIQYYIPIQILMCIGVTIAGITAFIVKRIQKLYQSGILMNVTEQTKTLLLETSIFDLCCDFWYFPGVALYIKALVSPLITGEPPEKTIHGFDHLSPDFKHKMLRKGIIHCLPNKLKKFILPDFQEYVNNLEPIQQEQQAEQQFEKNENNQPPRREINLLKTEVQYNEISQKVQDDTREIQEYVRIKDYQKMIQEEEEAHKFSNGLIKAMSKFMKGSNNVTKEDKDTLKRALFGASLALMFVLYRKRGSRKFLKNAVYTLVLFLGLSVSSGSLLLLYTHRKKQQLYQKFITEKKKQ